MEKQTTQTEAAGSFSYSQQIFLRYFTLVLVDLTVLNFFDEYWHLVTIKSFTISLLAAALLQTLLKLTIVIEHRIANYFKAKDGLSPKIQRALATWAVLFFSKIIILEAINFAFGDEVTFGGAFDGLVSFIVVVFAMLIVEQLIMRLYRALA